MAQNSGWRVGRACPLCPSISDIYLFRYGQGAIDLDTQIQSRAFDFCMSKQELNGPKISDSSINQRSFGATQ
jgi:hypothetical protein